MQCYLKASSPEKDKIGSYKEVSDVERVLTVEQAQKWTDYIKKTDNLFHELPAKQSKELVYEYASKTHLKRIPKSWERNKIAGLFLVNKFNAYIY